MTEESIARADDLRIEVGRETGPFFGEVVDFEVTTEEGGREIYVLGEELVCSFVRS